MKTERIVNISELEALLRQTAFDASALLKEVHKGCFSIERIVLLAEGIKRNSDMGANFEFVIEQREIRECMDIHISVTPKEIAALVVAIQERQQIKDPAEVIRKAFQKAIDDTGEENSCP